MKFRCDSRIKLSHIKSLWFTIDPVTFLSKTKSDVSEYLTFKMETTIVLLVFSGKPAIHKFFQKGGRWSTTIPETWWWRPWTWMGEPTSRREKITGRTQYPWNLDPPERGVRFDVWWGCLGDVYIDERGLEGCPHLGGAKWRNGHVCTYICVYICIHMHMCMLESQFITG